VAQLQNTFLKRFMCTTNASVAQTNSACTGAANAKNGKKLPGAWRNGDNSKLDGKRCPRRTDWQSNRGFVASTRTTFTVQRSFGASVWNR
jgi:hypothetical protein